MSALKAETGEERLIAGCEGVEFPPGTLTIEWMAHNIKTYKPFTQHGEHRDRASEDDSPEVIKTQSPIYITGRRMGRDDGKIRERDKSTQRGSNGDST
jgi:hypothetical protein